MILAKGEILASKEQGRILKELPEWLNQTLALDDLDPYYVIKACDELSKRISLGQYDHIISGIALDEKLIKEQLHTIINMLNKESLLYKLEVELGAHPRSPKPLSPPFCNTTLVKHTLPLGVLFHIAAGNVDGPPAFSVVEGLYLCI